LNISKFFQIVAAVGTDLRLLKPCFDTGLMEQVATDQYVNFLAYFSIFHTNRTGIVFSIADFERLA